MKLINIVLASASIFALASCGGVGSPESAGAKLTELECEIDMKKLEFKEANIEPEMAYRKFIAEAEAKFGNDSAQTVAFKQAYDAKRKELEPKYELRENEVEVAYETARDRIKAEKKVIKAAKSTPSLDDLDF